MKRLHPSRVTKVVAFLLIVGLAFWLTGARPSKSPFPAKIRLANGSTVEILNFGYSTEMPMQTLSLWERFLDNLPYKMQPGGLRMPISIPLQAKSLFIVYRPEKRLPLSVPDDGITLSIVDDNGFESIEDGEMYDLSTLTNIISGHVFKNFPKRSRNIKLRFYSSEKLQAEVSYPNPYTNTLPPIRLPRQTDKQTIGDQTIELQSVIWDMPAKGNRRLQKGATYWEKETVMKFVVTTKGKVDKRWMVTSLICEDATGNKIGPIRFDAYGIGDFYYVTFPEALWPVEPICFRMELTNATLSTALNAQLVVTPTSAINLKEMPPVHRRPLSFEQQGDVRDVQLPNF